MTIDASAITASLQLAADRAGDLVPLVYARLFAHLPEMEAEFWRDAKGSIRGEMLARAVEAVLDFAEDRRFSPAYLRTEMVTHDAYGIPRAVFGVFFQALAEAVADAAGPEWTAAMAAAWDGLRADIAVELAAVPGPEAPQPMYDPDVILPAARGIAFPHR